jgi:hypothetical protein
MIDNNKTKKRNIGIYERLFEPKLVIYELSFLEEVDEPEFSHLHSDGSGIGL